MKNLLIATVAVGATIAALLLYLRQQSTIQNRVENKVSDAAGDAYNTMNRHIGRTERIFDHALN